MSVVNVSMYRVNVCAVNPVLACVMFVDVYLENEKRNIHPDLGKQNLALSFTQSLENLHLTSPSKPTPAHSERANKYDINTYNERKR